MVYSNILDGFVILKIDAPGIPIGSSVQIPGAHLYLASFATSLTIFITTIAGLDLETKTFLTVSNRMLLLLLDYSEMPRIVGISTMGNVIPPTSRTIIFNPEVDSLTTEIFLPPLDGVGRLSG